MTAWYSRARSSFKRPMSCSRLTDGAAARPSRWAAWVACEAAMTPSPGLKGLPGGRCKIGAAGAAGKGGSGGAAPAAGVHQGGDRLAQFAHPVGLHEHLNPRPAKDIVGETLAEEEDDRHRRVDR